VVEGVEEGVSGGRKERWRDGEEGERVVERGSEGKEEGVE